MNPIKVLITRRSVLHGPFTIANPRSPNHVQICGQLSRNGILCLWPWLITPEGISKAWRLRDAVHFCNLPENLDPLSLLFAGWHATVGLIESPQASLHSRSLKQAATTQALCNTPC